ncbi:aspartyl/glutamyl-tRNA(Asn/Gln) amidotransferase subunit A [Scopulibacillus darangshiensis]|uniref:Aspartyl/glutamyl-tRNA(Asn/Gln) amidotransferase subunit A n=1 Tax=Scopulibacillus darangshiensis TaxID=442528 RepID=A0A4R2N8X5_9BACL|nr:amidase [Scopulibacillus darangshiensis]TCP17441.1 aspartyl/glutamyl-tRNA(Asn/Gln) amidotransferase subunit A [Scopulibacillus darangshiensis]
MEPIYYATISELAPLIRAKQLSPVKLTEAILARIEKLDPTLNSYITVIPEHALQQARQAEAEIMAGKYRGPLHGIPFAPKDIYYTKGVRTTSGSAFLRHFVPNYNATVIKRLEDAGCILTGKLNMNEFAVGETNINTHYGNVRNPWNTDCISGGSSGGSGAAVSAGLSVFSIGTDSAGSIRVPSAFCGVYGLKPTYGRVSLYGIPVLTKSLVGAGPMARGAEDLAIVMHTIAGFDPKDNTSERVPPDNYYSYLGKSITGIRIGLPDYFFKDLDQGVHSHVWRAIRDLEGLGAQFKEVSMPELSMSLVAEVATEGPEAAAYHHEILTTPKKELYQDYTRITLEAGELTTGMQYEKAQKARRVMRNAFYRTFEDVDVVAAPTVPITAPHFTSHPIEQNLDVWMRCTPYTSPADVTGLPSLSFPVGISNGLPVGMQILGKPFSEGRLLQIAYAYQKAVSSNKLMPIQ